MSLSAKIILLKFFILMAAFYQTTETLSSRIPSPCESTLFKTCIRSSSIRNFLVCSQFHSFDELDFTCKPDNITQLRKNRFYSLSIAPKTPLLFNLNLNALNSPLFKHGQVSLMIYHITGIDLFHSNFFTDSTERSITIMDSVFQVYANNSLLNSRHPLVLNNFKSLPLNFKSLFTSNNYEVIFRSSVVFKTPIHPILFKDSYIETLKVFGLTESFLRVNLMEFMNVNLSFRLNSNVNILFLYVNQARLKSSMFNAEIHGTVTSLNVIGEITGIDQSLFRKLVSLNWITFKVASLRDFFRSTGLEWIRELDNLSTSLKNLNFEQTDQREINIIEPKRVFYDEDFCIYSLVNVSKNIVIQMHEMLTSNCSCSFIWLIQTSLPDHYWLNCMDNTRNLTWFWSNCKFDERLSRCNRNEFSTRQHSKLATDASHLHRIFSDVLKVAKFYTVISAKPFLCLVCILISFIDMRIIYDNEKIVNDKAKMYYYILIAAIVDTIIALIYLTELLNECIEPYGIFCAEFRKNMQIFKASLCFLYSFN